MKSKHLSYRQLLSYKFISSAANQQHSSETKHQVRLRNTPLESALALSCSGGRGRGSKMCVWGCVNKGDTLVKSADGKTLGCELNQQTLKCVTLTPSFHPLVFICQKKKKRGGGCLFVLTEHQLPQRCRACSSKQRCDGSAGLQRSYLRSAVSLNRVRKQVCTHKSGLDLSESQLFNLQQQKKRQFRLYSKTSSLWGDQA